MSTPTSLNKVPPSASVRGDFCQKLVVAETYRDSDSEFPVYPRCELREQLGRTRVMQALRAGKIEEHLIDRQGLDERRQSPHGGAYLTPYRLVLRHVRPDHDSIRAGHQRLEHRHR